MVKRPDPDAHTHTHVMLANLASVSSRRSASTVATTSASSTSPSMSPLGGEGGVEPPAGRGDTPRVTVMRYDAMMVTCASRCEEAGVDLETKRRHELAILSKRRKNGVSKKKGGIRRRRKQSETRERRSNETQERREIRRKREKSRGGRTRRTSLKGVHMKMDGWCARPRTARAASRR